MKQTRKPKIIFVGAFSASGGVIGGQMAACDLLLESPLSDLVQWQIVDTSAPSQPPPGFVIRTLNACGRLGAFIWRLAFGGASGVLIFSSYELASIAEKGLMCILGKAFRKRVVLSLQSEIKPFSYDRWFLWFKRWGIRSCDVILAQSEAAAQNLVRLLGCPTSKITVVPSWIDPAKYAGLKAGLNEAQNNGATRYLFLGWLEPWKGVGDLIDAAGLLADRQQDFRLVVCGGGSQREMLEQKCEQLALKQRVEFRGWTLGEAKLDALREADIFVLPSLTEGFPNALLEAMATGLPVIATPVGGVPSLIEPEQNGLLVAPGDSAALAGAMARLAEDRALARRMAQANQDKVTGHYNIAHAWRQVARALGLKVEGS